MALTVGGDKGGLRSEIDVTPMADVVIVLLVVFMVVTPALAARGVELPSAEAGQAPAPAPHEVAIPEDGRAVYGDKPVTLDELETLLGVALAARPDEVRVRADRRLRYASVGPVIEACRRAGATKVAVLVDRRVGQ